MSTTWDSLRWKSLIIIIQDEPTNEAQGINMLPKEVLRAKKVQLYGYT